MSPVVDVLCAVLIVVTFMFVVACMALQNAYRKIAEQTDELVVLAELAILTDDELTRLVSSEEEV